MAIFDSMGNTIEYAEIIYEGMKHKADIATPEELPGVYCDAVIVTTTYEAMLLLREPGTEIYKTIKGIYESQKALVENIEARAKAERINLKC
ncbi:MAG: hypothetical protein GOV02_01680 [Candidatus Aenigmarchaeota archaeon]|nr:hypothetical protein [Candidatus Aenigmarchaeota archaeon]